jgi:hypothetical protein
LIRLESGRPVLYRQRRLGRGGVAFVAGGLIAALGEYGYLYSWMRRFVPLLGVGRYPVKFMALPAFAAPLLGAFAVASPAGVARIEVQSAEQMFDAIAALDARHAGRESETAADEWGRYAAERARLKAELERALAAGRRPPYS